MQIFMSANISIGKVRYCEEVIISSLAVRVYIELLSFIKNSSYKTRGNQVGIDMDAQPGASKNSAIITLTVKDLRLSSKIKCCSIEHLFSMLFNKCTDRNLVDPMPQGRSRMLV